MQQGRLPRAVLARQHDQRVRQIHQHRHVEVEVCKNRVCEDLQEHPGPEYQPTAIRPERTSKASGSGSRPMNRLYSSAGSSLSPRDRMLSRKAAPTSELKMPSSRNRVNASASRTSAHLYE